MYEILSLINNFIWGNGLIFLLLVTGIFFTLKLKFIQFRMPAYLFGNMKNHNNKGLSQFRTVCMSLGTSMGTGNITGAAAAIAVGGAGAVFWMWVSAFLGMSLVYAENSLSVIFSNKNSVGSLSYIEKAFRSRIIAVIFAVFCIFCSFGMGGMVQVNAFAESLSVYSGNKYITAFVIFLIILSVISGGARRIGAAAQYLMPLASLLYAVLCIAVMIRFRENIIPSFGAIFREAFGFRQAAGGSFGYAVSAGIRRGIFSNEAGLGSSPILHSAAESDNPQTQGMWSVFEVFFDTCICCTLTALTVLCSGEENIISVCNMLMGKYGGIFFTAEIGIFAFCTVIGWYYCGESAYKYIFGRKNIIFCIIFSAAASTGALWEMKEIWTLSDIFNGLMMIPNICALIILSENVKNKYV
ncbi:MAG TPA: sodium:alanine symporter family protein [Ruminococcus sp.]|nr:sodium:alanine symporter family protein [Ruminococcus sp.]